MIVDVIVVGEGQTEETFVRDVLTPTLAHRDIMVQARLIPTSKFGRGGALKRDRVVRYLRNTLRERVDTYVTTFFDLYALDRNFPGSVEAARVVDPVKKAETVETALRELVVNEAGCRIDRFLPHIQPFEFEALLFSDISRFTDVEHGWEQAVPALRAIREAVASPEHINGGTGTHPSARLAQSLHAPDYSKLLHGVLLAESIGITRIRSECLHFGAWIKRLLTLPPLKTPSVEKQI